MLVGAREPHQVTCCGYTFCSIVRLGKEQELLVLIYLEFFANPINMAKNAILLHEHNKLYYN